MSRIVFRTDAGPAIGSGHVVRSLALASAFSKGGWKIAFASTRETFDGVRLLAGTDVEKLILDDPKTEAQKLAAKWPDGVDILVVDHYTRDATFEGACRPWAKRIVVIDDLANRHHDCDVLVDSNATSEAAYKPRTPTRSLRLIGPAFAALAPEFRAARAAALTRRGNARVERVFVSFGQFDSGNATCFALDALETSGYSGAIDVVLGGSAPHLRAVQQKANDRIKIHVDTSNMAAIMSAADIGLGAGGTTSWERCCLGLPALMLEIAENQRGVMALIESAHAGIALGRAGDVKIETMIEAVRSLMGDSQKRAAMAKAGAALVDGRGAERIMLAAIGPSVTKTGQRVTLRPMEPADENWLLDLQKKPETRKFANVTDTPSAGEHTEWFARTLNDPTTLLMSILSDRKPVGMLRLDRNDDGARVSIAVDPAYHRLGIAEAALALAHRLNPGKVLEAEIKPENAASLAVFRAAGYRPRQGNLYRREPHE